MLLELRNACSATETALLKKTSKTIARRAFVQRTFAKGIRRKQFWTFFRLSVPSFVQAQRLSTSIRGTFKLRCLNCVVRTTLYLLRNWNFVSENQSTFSFFQTGKMCSLQSIPSSVNRVVCISIFLLFSL